MFPYKTLLKIKFFCRPFKIFGSTKGYHLQSQDWVSTPRSQKSLLDVRFNSVQPLCSSLPDKCDDGIKVVRGQNFKINKRGGQNKRGGGISVGKERTVTLSILKLDEHSRCQNLTNLFPVFDFYNFSQHLNGFFTTNKNAILYVQL